MAEKPSGGSYSRRCEMEKELKETMGAAWDELLTVNNKLCCIAGLIDPRDSDHGLVLDFTESIGA